jgi:hypothetical protein
MTPGKYMPNVATVDCYLQDDRVVIETYWTTYDEAGQITGKVLLFHSSVPFDVIEGAGGVVTEPKDTVIDAGEGK